MFARNKINIYDYTDYRKFLQDFYEFEKSLDTTFSYRVFAAAVCIDASLLVKILQGKRHVSSKGLETFVDFFRFKEAKAEYFREMVAYGKAKTKKCASISRHSRKCALPVAASLTRHVTVTFSSGTTR